jgi:hypothetical protein
VKQWEAQWILASKHPVADGTALLRTARGFVMLAARLVAGLFALFRLLPY